MKKILILILLFLSITSYSYAEGDVSPAAKKWFTNYARNISAKNTDQKEILYFEGFANNLNELIAKKKLSEVQINLINDLIKLSNEHIFNIVMKLNESESKSIIDKNTILSDFKYKSYNSENIFLENGVWYTYNYDKHLAFKKGVNISNKDLEHNNIYSETSLVILKKDGNLGFVIDYQKVKLISDNIIYGVSDKYDLLIEIKDDKRKLNTETDEIFNKLKQDSINLTKGKTKDIKIKLIYNYVLSNVEYPKVFSLEDARLVSGIDTYKNKSGICAGYSKMFKYMMNFANINNVKVISGNVIDALDFPKVGHAWVVNGNDYYDPTFDDPLGNTKTKVFEQYSYYKLPKDLFYTNRYDADTLPEYLKNKDMDFRKGIINQKNILLVDKYKNSGYNLLKPYILRVNHGIKPDKKLNIDDLISIMGYSEVENLKVIKDGKTKSIGSLLYYVIDGSSVENMLEQLEYNLDGYYLYKWKLDDGSYEYRLAYNVVFN